MGDIAPELVSVEVEICDWCLVAKGDECHTPGCLFCRQSVPKPALLPLTRETQPYRDALIQWGNGYVRCLVCGHQAHGGEWIPHDESCVMYGFTKTEHAGKSVPYGKVGAET